MVGTSFQLSRRKICGKSSDYGTNDNPGNVKSQQITVPSQFTANQVYSYDSLNRLKSAQETISGSQTWKQTYTFDRYGNRKFDANQTTTLGNCPVNICNPNVNPANNKVVGHSFDNAGNTTVDAEGKQFFYDAENKQKEVRNASNQIIGQYLFDGDGKRVKKLSSQETVIFVFDAGGKLASEYQVSASQSQSPTTSYLTNDTLGSPRVTTDSSGAVISRRDFRPYGEEIYRANQGTDKVRQKFTSYERDNETELDFAQARMYASKLGRFTSPDALMASAVSTQPQTWNRYFYVANNPLSLIDPTGNIILIAFSEGRGKSKTDQLVEYKDGKLYTGQMKDGKFAIGGEYKGDNRFAMTVQSQLNQLKTLDGKGSTLKNRLTTLEKSDLIHTIHFGKNERDDASTPKNTSNRNEGCPTGTDVNYNPYDSGIFKEINGSTSYSTPLGSLAHELLGHSWDSDQGQENPEVGSRQTFFDDLGIRTTDFAVQYEINAVIIENIVYRATAQPVRTNYKVDISKALQRGIVLRNAIKPSKK